MLPAITDQFSCRHRPGVSAGRAIARAARWGAGAVLAAAASSFCIGCESCGSKPEPGPVADAGPVGLSPELAARVLARVGDRTITLGDYAAALERMDRFERLRYQTADRRQALLDEMINLELLAREAEARGLDQRPETRARVDELLRDETLRRLRQQAPSWEQVPAAAVREYYDAHATEFLEPERRRAAVIAFTNKAAAEAALREALPADASGWARLVARTGPAAALPEPGDRTEARPGLTIPGDLGLVSAPSSGASDNERIPEPVRTALFTIAGVDGVYPELVIAGGRFYVVRLAGKSESRQRTLAEVERTVRVRVVEAQQAAAEAALLARLRTEFPVRVNEAELERVPAPDAGSPAP